MGLCQVAVKIILCSKMRGPRATFKGAENTWPKLSIVLLFSQGARRDCWMLPQPLRCQILESNRKQQMCIAWLVYAFMRLSTLSGTVNKLVTNAVLDEVLHHSVWVRGSCCDCAVGQLTEHIPLWL